MKFRSSVRVACLSFSIVGKLAAKDLALHRLNYLQSSIALADVIVQGSPEVKKHVLPVRRMNADILHITPDTLYLEMSGPKELLGPPTKGKIEFKLVARLEGREFEVTKEMIFFLRRTGPGYYAIDFKKSGGERFSLENEVIDTNRIIEKGKVGHLSINRNWKVNWTESGSRRFSIPELKEYIRNIRSEYRLVPYCFSSPIDVGVYFLPKNEKKLFRGELGVLNEITEMMVRKSIEKKQRLEKDATPVNIEDKLCESILYD